MCDNNHYINVKIKNKAIITIYEKQHIGFLIKGLEKQIARGYILSEYPYLTNKSTDLEIIQIFCGDIKVHDFKY
jgi:hypothetical protein